MIPGMPYARGDTAEHAEREQIRALAALSSSCRLALALEMSDVARDLALSGLRAREPSLGESDITRRFLETIRGWRIAPPRAASPAA
jgi:hypothetical protein